jgi:uncharacterized protein (TIGR03083 family)
MTSKADLVTLLGEEWSILSELLAGLDDDGWSTLALPGWDVHDVVAHLVGMERLLDGAQQPELPAEGAGLDHVRNDIGRVNESWVIELRSRTHAELLADFRAIAAVRLASLEAMTQEEFDAPSWTPAGQATYGRFMRIRLFDCWMHEQDIRAAVGRPGNEAGPIAEVVLEEVTSALGYVVGKLGRAPDGSAVLIRLTGPIERDLRVVVDGRARVVDALPGDPTTTLALSSTLFFRLLGGRVDAAEAASGVEFAGDTAVAGRIAANLAYTI